MNLMKPYKKVVASLILGVYLLLTVSVPFASAQWYNQSFKQFYTQVYGPATPPQEIFGERYTAAQTQWVVYSFLALVLNAIAEAVFHENAEEIVNTMMTGEISSDSSLAPNPVAYYPPVTPKPQQSLISAVFEDRPISTVTSIKNGLKNFHLIPEAKAQAATGFGFQALKPVQELWKLSRNISYTLFVLASIILSFMIMFRVQTSARVVVTVQSAIPKIAITLILVTFSYAIAGFMVDLMYVTMGLLALMIGGTGNAVQIFTFLTKGPGGGGILSMLLITIATYLLSLIAIFVGGLTGGSAVGTLTFGLVAIVIIVLMLIFMIFQAFKIIVAIFRALAFVLLLTMIAPLQITAGLIFPGMGFSTWLKSLISNLAVFPTISVLFLFSLIFAKAAVIGFGGQGTVPSGALSFVTDLIAGVPFIGISVDATGYGDLATQGWPPLFGFSGNTSVYIMFFILSFVLLSITPKVPEIIKGFIAGKAFFASTLGDVGAVGGAATAGGSRYGADRILTAREEGFRVAAGDPNASRAWHRAARRFTGTRPPR